MAIAIELWADGRLIGGMEQWWDDVEAWLVSADGERQYPVLSQVDPYGFLTVKGDDLQVLLRELERARSEVPPAVAASVERLIELCESAMRRSAAELRFIGD